GYFIGFENIYSCIIFIGNLDTSEIIRASTVTFLEEDLVNYEDLGCSSNRDVVKYYIIFLN
ncbi:hypothetical protein QR685DRAFT_440399, partial [Neurospora intermedia]